MKRLAIIVAVSEYTEQQNLTACANDGAAIHGIISATKRFDDILYLTGPKETQGARAQDAFAGFAEKYRGQEVSELFFYFTGHGHFDGENLDLLLSDYSDSKRKQTSFQNSEVDATVRALSPDLYVKIIDACQSGVSYIKSYENFGDYLKGSSSGLNNVYFMFSSNSDQSSYANSTMSYFTKSLIKSVADHKSEKLRYKDVVNALSDEYESNQKQTPYFVTQAGMTETFVDLNPEIRKIANSFLGAGKIKPASPNGPESKEISLLEKIRAAEGEIASEEVADMRLDEIYENLASSALSGDLEKLYEWTVDELEDLPDGTLHIGKWLDSNDSENQFFCKKTYRAETYTERVPKRSLFASNWSRLLVSSLEDTDDDRTYRTVTRTRNVVSGFEHTVNLPYDAIRIWLDPKSAALTPEQCIVIPLVSRTRFQVFWRFSHFRYVDWENTTSTSRSDWAIASVPILDQKRIEDLSNRIKKEFTTYVLNALNARWGSESGADQTLAGTKLLEQTEKPKSEPTQS